MIAYEIETIVEGDHIAIADIAVCDERVFVATASGMLVYGVGEGDRLRGGASGTQIVYDKKFSKKPVTKIEIDRRNKILFSLSGIVTRSVRCSGFGACCLTSRLLCAELFV
jgi:hypothetical protein